MNLDGLTDLLRDQTYAMNVQWQNGYTFGRQAGKKEALEGILAAYDRALADPETKMPSYLHAAIEAQRMR